MIKYFSVLLAFTVLLPACGRKHHGEPAAKETAPVVANGGLSIRFPDPESMTYFKTATVSVETINADFTSPAKIAATVVSSEEGATQNIVLFENPELAGSYTQLIQHQINISQIQNINIKQKQIQLDRTEDLQKHGAATGKDVLDAQMALAMEQTNLANERAALIEHEAKLKAAGFSPDLLRKSKAGTAYLTCDVPENQIDKIKEGSTCSILFTAYPDEQYTGKIEHVADVVDNLTRMIKLRISVNNSSSKLKSGMFATVSFGVNEGKFISVSKNALLTVQGKSYVFVQKDANTFERREVQAGQQIGDRVLVYSGIVPGENIVVQGAMQLKGLSFGY